MEHLLWKHLSDKDARVAFIDIQEDASHELETSLASEDFPPVFINCDLTDITSLKKSVKQIEHDLGAVRVLVNNAANDQRHEPEDVTPEYWEERIKLNLNHHFLPHRLCNLKWQKLEEDQSLTWDQSAGTWHLNSCLLILLLRLQLKDLL